VTILTELGGPAPKPGQWWAVWAANRMSGKAVGRANSGMDRVLATVERLDPTMTVLDDARRPLRDARDAAELAKQMP
jgi:hypothetical protein